MTKLISKPPFGLQNLFRLFLILFGVECIAFLVYLFSSASEPSVAALAGFSIRRIVIIAGVFLLLVGAIIVLLDSFRTNKFVRFISPLLKLIFRNYFITSLIRSSFFLLLMLSLFYEFYTPFFYRLVPFPIYFIDRLALTIGQYAGILTFWFFLVVLKLYILIIFFERNQPEHESKSALTRWTATAWAVAGTFFLLYFFRNSIRIHLSSPSSLTLPTEKALLLAIWLSAWDLFRKYYQKADRFFVLLACISVWLVTSLVYRQMAQWMGTLSTPQTNYFNILAESFLHGRLDLINSPAKFDLTPYHGKWYVPFPPSPAFLLLPFIAILGVKAINTTNFSIILGALTCTIVFLIFHEQKKLKWIQLSYSGITWLVVLFSFGTVYWWLTGLSQNSYFSQTCTVFFCALSFWFALKKYPAWLTGLALMGGVMARPDVFILWPALAAITIQIDHDKGERNWKQYLRWSIISGITLGIGALLLLYYNYLRFGNLLDFGYTTINGWDRNVQRANEWGIFSTHFLPDNLHLIFIGFSYRLIAGCEYFIPRGDGMNIFFTTPGIVYLFRKFKINWWLGGCWLSILLILGLLSMYHNDGAIQYGYRYLMDFIIPVMMILALNAGKKISIPFRILISISILINYYAILSWQRSPC